MLLSDCELSEALREIIFLHDDQFAFENPKMRHSLHRGPMRRSQSDSPLHLRQQFRRQAQRLVGKLFFRNGKLFLLREIGFPFSDTYADLKLESLEDAKSIEQFFKIKGSDTEVVDKRFLHEVKTAIISWQKTIINASTEFKATEIKDAWMADLQEIKGLEQRLREVTDVWRQTWTNKTDCLTLRCCDETVYRQLKRRLLRIHSDRFTIRLLRTILWARGPRYARLFVESMESFSVVAKSWANQHAYQDLLPWLDAVDSRAHREPHRFLKSELKKNTRLQQVKACAVKIGVASKEKGTIPERIGRWKNAIAAVQEFLYRRCQLNWPRTIAKWHMRSHMPTPFPKTLWELTGPFGNLMSLANLQQALEIVSYQEDFQHVEKNAFRNAFFVHR